MTDQEPDEAGTGTRVDVAASPGNLEQVVDDLEDRVLGHRVDQERDEDDAPDKPAFEQDLDTEDSGSEPEAETGPGAEPSS